MEENLMSMKEEKAREYVDQKVKDKNLYPLVGFCRRKQLTTFKSSELEKSFKAGWDAGAEWQKERDMLMSDCRNFGECYELGKKDMKEQMMDKACEWLEDNLLSYWQQCVTDPEEFIKEFRKAMEEEK